METKELIRRETKALMYSIRVKGNIIEVLKVVDDKMTT